MHTCPPPKAELKKKFLEYPTEHGRLGHILLEQKEVDDGELASALRAYFESAHLDAREHFHALIGIDLHPDADGDVPIVTYPASLPSTTRRGLFGEVLAGLLTEAYTFVGKHSWCVPVFLFRYHDDASNYLFTLARDPTQVRQTIGRLGTDFIGLSIGDGGGVARIISGEAKWRETLYSSTVETLMLGDLKEDDAGNKVRTGKGIWRDLNREPSPPSGARQLQRLLQDLDPDGFDAAILSLEKALVVKGAVSIPKTDLIVIAGNGASKREEGDVHLPWQEMPNEYTAGNDLQIVEVVFKDGVKLIDAIYSSLWAGVDNA
jgi:hypothetical protein